MGTNQTGKRFYQVKIKGLDIASIKELGRLMRPLQMQAFRKAYGNILDLTIAEISTEAVVSLTQYYDQPLRCFTFGDFQLVPTIEEFEEILGCPLGGRKPYLFSGFLPSLGKIAVVVRDSARELDRVKQTRNGVVGLPRKYLEDKAKDMANQEEWVPYMDVLALLIFGVVLFPNMDGLVDLAAIDAFLAYHHSKESPVVAILADLFDTFDRRCEKSSAQIIFCLPALCVWLVSHLLQQDIRHPCPLRSHRSCVKKRRVDWDQHLAGIGGRTINWFPRWKEGKEGVIFSCGDYPNIPLIGTRGCINYNPALAIRQLGYPMRGAPTEESLSPFLVRDFGAQSFKNFEALEEDEEVLALKIELGKARLAKEKFKLVATDVRKKCAGLREENAATARPLEQETKRARKEEQGRDKFRGALWGSNSELKLQREEKDQSRAHSMVLKEELAACSRSKRNLSQRLRETETNMLAIINKYQEELNLATAHEHKVADEYAQVTMGDQEETHEQMKADMSALKEQMASMMEAMLGMRQLMENNVATAAAVSSAAEADPTLLATAHHPLPNAVGRERSTLGHISNPHLGYNRVAYPHGLPPNYTAPVMRDDAGHVPSLVLEGEPPRQLDEVHEDHREYAQVDVDFYPPVPVEGSAPNVLPQPNLPTQPIFFFADLVFAGERIEVGLKRGKFDYVASTSTNARWIGATGQKGRKEIPMPSLQHPHGLSHHRPLMYAQHHPSFSACAGDSSNSAPVQPRAPAPIQREAPQAPAPTTTRPAGNTHFGAGSNVMRNFPPRPTPEFTPIPMTYEDLLPSLIANQMAVISPGKIYQSPFLKWYNPDAICAYHGKTLGHSTEKCLALKYKPNVKTNPLANHGGGAVNAVESGKPPRSKPLKDVTTPRRFIYETLQKGGVIPHGGHEEDSCLMHPGELHDMETCLAVEDLLQQMIDRGRLEVSDEGSEEQHICMQSADERSFGRPKPLVVYFTKDVAPQAPRYPSIVKPVLFPYRNNHAVSWRYAPPSERKEEATDISSLSAKVTNITGLSGVTRSGRVFAPPDLSTQPANVKGKTKIVEEQNDKMTLTPNEDIQVKGLPKKRDGCGKKEVSLEEAGEFLRIIPQSKFKVIEQLNKTPARVSLLELLMSSEPHRALLVKVLNEAHEPRMGLGKNNGGRTSLISIRGNRGKFGLGYKPTQADIRKSVAGRKSGSQGSASLGHEGQVIMICEDDSPSGSNLVRPCPPGFQLGNWRVEERPDIYATNIISDDESIEGINTWDLTIDFKQETDQTEGGEDEDEQNRLRQWSNVGTGLKAKTNRGKTVTRPRFAVRCRSLLSST
ncbi:hypothetical protein HKD37_03G007245 [Glycine soja]